MATHVRSTTRSLLKPILSSPSQPTTCQYRLLHHSPVLMGKGGSKMRQKGAIGGGGQAFPQSPSAQRKRMLEDMGQSRQLEKLDMGILPLTFIFPTGENRSALWKSFPKWKFFAFWRDNLWIKISNFAMLMYMRFTNFGPRWFIPSKTHRARRAEAARFTKHDKKEVTTLALEKHSKIWSAFAEARVEDIEKICKEGLAESMRQRMSRRTKFDVLEWNTVGPTTAKIVSSKQLASPVSGKGLDSFVQQVVVRISGQQRLRKGTKVDGQGWTKQDIEAKRNVKWTPDGERIQPVTELLVLQRTIAVPAADAVDRAHGRVGDWIVWGFAQETTLENIDEVVKNEDKKLFSSAADRKTFSAA